jgi:hypothetical protein
MSEITKRTFSVRAKGAAAEIGVGGIVLLTIVVLALMFGAGYVGHKLTKNGVIN